MANTLTAAGAMMFMPESAKAQAVEDNTRLHFFTKPLQSLDFEPLAATLAEAGYGGLDLAVRPKGHIEPERVAGELPRAVAAATKYGLKVEMIVTAITDAQEPLAERILQNAAQCGIKIYRMGYYKYDLKAKIEDSLDKFRRQMAHLEALNRKCGITGCYQNHYAWSGDLVGGAIWDLYTILKGLDHKWIGCQYDVRHAVAEAYGSWSTGMRLVAPWIRSTCLKDFVWSVRGGRTVPGNAKGGEGIVPWERYFELCRELAIAVPASVHCEWELLNKQEEALPEAEKRRLIVPRLAQEAHFFKESLKKHGVST